MTRDRRQEIVRSSSLRSHHPSALPPPPTPSTPLSLSRYIAEVATWADSAGANFQTEAIQEEVAQTVKYLANVRIISRKS